MYIVLHHHRVEELCVLIIDKAILYLKNVVISDENAARDWAMFEPSPDGLDMLKREEVFSESWMHPDPYEKERLKGAMCAEVLVPDSLETKYILGAYVAGQRGYELLSGICPDLTITINNNIFFRRG
jgi:hypothetical protein